MSDTIPSPLTPTMLEHLRWQIEQGYPHVVAEPEVMARLLDDRRDALKELRELLRCSSIDDHWREPAERLLLRMEP